DAQRSFKMPLPNLFDRSLARLQRFSRGLMDPAALRRPPPCFCDANPAPRRERIGRFGRDGVSPRLPVVPFPYIDYCSRLIFVKGRPSTEARRNAEPGE